MRIDEVEVGKFYLIKKISDFGDWKGFPLEVRKSNRWIGECIYRDNGSYARFKYIRTTGRRIEGDNSNTSYNWNNHKDCIVKEIKEDEIDGIMEKLWIYEI